MSATMSLTEVDKRSRRVRTNRAVSTSGESVNARLDEASQNGQSGGATHHERLEMPSQPVAVCHVNSMEGMRDRVKAPGANGSVEGGLKGWVRRFRPSAVQRYRVFGYDKRTKGEVDKTIIADDLEHAKRICRMVGIHANRLAPVR